MRLGDTVRLITPVSRCVYQVVPGFDGHANPYVVAPTDVAVVSQAGDLGGGPWLTLTSCNPPGSAAQRIVLRLRMTSCNGSSCQHQGSAT
jgi:sortase (surface protein transpeptidase)